MKRSNFSHKVFYFIFVLMFIFFVFPFFVVKIFGLFNMNKVDKNFITTVNAIHENEFRGIWFSFLEWKKYNNFSSEEEWGKKIDEEIVKNLKSLKINNVFVHAVSHSDSFFKSELCPISKILSKEYGKTIKYDPFKVLVNKLKENGFKVHAWINPLRGMFEEEYSKVDDSYQIKKWFTSKNKFDYYMKDKTGRYWLNPSNEEVRSFVKKIVEELIKKYDKIDGIHIDDYFYPAGLSSKELLNDDLGYYKKKNLSLGVEDWRRQSVTKLVKEIYECCKSKNKIFGVSPQGNISNNFNNMFFDQEDIIKKGYVDYIIPQIYYGFNNEVSPFSSSVEKWEQLILKNKNKDKKIDFYVGLAAYKCGMENDLYAKKGSAEWKNNSDILKRQVEFLRTKKECGGYTFFTYNSFFYPEDSRKKSIESEKNKLLAILN